MAGISYSGTVVAALGVRDFRRALAWYKDVLGLETVYSFEEPMKWGEISTPVPGLTIGVGEAPEDAPGAGGMMLSLGVTDIEAARAELESKGVSFAGPTQEIPGMVKLATFSDPDGNQFMLVQTLSDLAG